MRIAEAAVCKLDIAFGKQGRRFYYRPAGRRLQEGSSSSAQRTKVSLKVEQLLQILVYAESDPWERGSEFGTTSLMEEDMVIRFVKHLIQISLKRNSFYVTLGVGRLLYDYETSQVRQMYDVLMQDQARFRDNSYLRKQKKLLMKELLDRFGKMIRVARTAQKEDRFETQPLTDSLIGLVRECLRRFTPWDTTCVFPERFDPAARVPALSFSGTQPDDESPVEMNRIHTIIDPNCFARLVDSLGFPAPDERLVIPKFFFSNDNPPPGDRFNPPPLSEEHELRLKRARDDRARRRKAYRPGQLRVYVDEVEAVTFDPRSRARVEFTVPPNANVVEVRGSDESGELPLATLLVTCDSIPTGGSLADSLTLEDGQKLTTILTPVIDAAGEIEEIRVELAYGETQPLRIASSLMQRAGVAIGLAKRPNEESKKLKPRYSWLVKIAVVSAILLGGLIIIWRQLNPASRDLPAPAKVELPPTPTRDLLPPTLPSPTPIEPQRDRPPSALIAQATWSRNSDALTDAVRLEVRRGNVPTVDISVTKPRLLIAVNRTDAEERKYQRYRFRLIADENTMWESTLRAPQVGSSGRVHVLNLALSPQRFPKAGSYRLRVEGETQDGWQPAGQLMLNVANR